MLRLIKVVLCLTAILAACGKKYKANFYTESANRLTSLSGPPEQRTFSAKSEKDAYREALEMLIELEKNNDLPSFIFSDVEVFNKDGSFIKLSKDEQIEIRSTMDLNYLSKRKEEKEKIMMDKISKNDTALNRIKKELFNK